MGHKNFWNDLHDALANDGGWKALGGKESWGPVKFGHTSPLTSNSGAQTLMLLAYGYHNKSSGLTSADVNDPAFAQWLAEIESGVASFGDSTGTFMNDIVAKGPSQYDFGVVYENSGAAEHGRRTAAPGPAAADLLPAGDAVQRSPVCRASMASGPSPRSARPRSCSAISCARPRSSSWRCSTASAQPTRMSLSPATMPAIRSRNMRQTASRSRSHSRPRCHRLRS